MICPRCNENVKPTEVDTEAEIVVYDCPVCSTSWHLDLERTLASAGNPPRIVVNEENTLYWLVTNECPGAASQEQRPGWKQALETACGYLERAVLNDESAIQAINGPSHHNYEVSATPDPLMFKAGDVMWGMQLTCIISGHVVGPGELGMGAEKAESVAEEQEQIAEILNANEEGQKVVDVLGDINAERDRMTKIAVERVWKDDGRHV